MSRILLKKRYKLAEWLESIFRIASILCCSVPEVVAAFVVAPTYKESYKRTSISTFAIIVVAIMLFIVFAVVKKKITVTVSFSVSVAISFVALTFTLYAIRSVIDDVILILAVGSIGAVVGVIMELISGMFKSMAQELRDEYKYHK